jgi:ribosomal protection tetracycline resistance protein
MAEHDITNIGIIAHVDAGKTTLTEQLLFRSGAILRAGSVDQGTAQTDYMDVERKRGISVKAATTYIRWRDKAIN